MRRDLLRLAGGLLAVGAATAGYVGWLHVTNATTVAVTFLLIVLMVAATSPLWAAVATSVAAMLCFNFFFLPPVGTFSIADPQNWIALFAFLTVSLVASHLSSIARARATEAVARRDEVARLFDLSRDILLMTDSRDAIAQLARYVSRRFDIDGVAICLPQGEAWDVATAGSRALTIDPHQLDLAYAGVEQALEFDARARTYSGHREVMAHGHAIRLVPLRLGTTPIGLLASSGRPIEPGTLDAIAGVAAIAIERTQFLDDRKTADLARQSEELKSALLASLGHDLRTPLTAIRVAASNLQAAWLSDAERREQSELVLTEVEHLTRVFQNVLEMARIDAGPIANEARWVAPSEIVESARLQVERTLGLHDLDVAIESPRLVKLDPRLTAAALSHLLENAAQYSPAEAPITVSATVSTEGLTLRVRDGGLGISAEDLPHLFDRFYRGADAKQRVSGTGMGLAIVRGLLAAEGGRVWAENAVGGGAQFTIVVPADSKLEKKEEAPV